MRSEQPASMADRGAAGLCIGSKTRIVMVREMERSDSKWKFPVGSVKNGESPSETAAREADEEACFSADPWEMRPRLRALRGKQYRPDIFEVRLSEQELDRRVAEAKRTSRHRHIQDFPVREEWVGNEDGKPTRVRVFPRDPSQIPDMLDQHAEYLRVLDADEQRCA